MFSRLNVTTSVAFVVVISLSGLGCEEHLPNGYRLDTGSFDQQVIVDQDYSVVVEGVASVDTVGESIVEGSLKDGRHFSLNTDTAKIRITESNLTYGTESKFVKDLGGGFTLRSELGKLKVFYKEDVVGHGQGFSRFRELDNGLIYLEHNGPGRVLSMILNRDKREYWVSMSNPKKKGMPAQWIRGDLNNNGRESGVAKPKKLVELVEQATIVDEQTP